MGSNMLEFLNGYYAGIAVAALVATPIIALYVQHAKSKRELAKIEGYLEGVQALRQKPGQSA